MVSFACAILLRPRDGILQQGAVRRNSDQQLFQSCMQYERRNVEHNAKKKTRLHAYLHRHIPALSRFRVRGFSYATASLCALLCSGRICNKLKTGVSERCTRCTEMPLLLPVDVSLPSFFFLGSDDGKVLVFVTVSGPGIGLRAHMGVVLVVFAPDLGCRRQ